MDFASLMKQQLSKSCPNPSPKTATTTTTTQQPPKYIRKADAEAARQAAYAAERRTKEQEAEIRAAAKRKREDEIAAENKVREEKRRKLGEESRKLREEKAAEEDKKRRKRLGLPEVAPKEDQEEKAAESVSEDDEDDEVAAIAKRVEGMEDDEVKTNLRKVKEPVTLFGEDNTARRKRLIKLLGTALQPKGPIQTTLRLVPEKDMRVDGTVPADKKGQKYLFRQLASYFNMILREWELALAQESNNTFAGKAAYNAMAQSKETMKPLFRKFESRTLDPEILKAVVSIVNAAQERRYVDANNDYLHLSIGKAAWPIGVTMVGIHERSAREKLHDGEKGHVMGDEVTRKFLQSIKRCLTFAQTRWPPDDVRQLMG